MAEKQEGPFWTESQKEAIYKTDTQLLVAAGAGSGKTSVLTERILQKVLSGKDVDSFLVTTFTNTSAEDMKEKLRKKLLKEYSADTGNKHLSTQISKLSFAQISTISSFCLKLVKQHFEVLGLSAGVRIADEGEANMLFDNAIDTLLDNCFETKDESLHKLLTLSGCARNEGRLIEYLSKIYEKLRAHPRYIKRLNEATDGFVNSINNATSINDLRGSNVYEFIHSMISQSYSSPENQFQIMSDLSFDALSEVTDNYISFFTRGYELLEKREYLLSSQEFGGADKFCKDGWGKTRLSKFLSEADRKTYEEARKASRKVAQDLAQLLLEIETTLIDELSLCAELMSATRSLIVSLDEIYTKLKREKGIVDFTDTEQYAYNLLIDEDGNPTALCKEIALSTEEVLVDEYQDTNPLQDAIFAAIATKNNRFMVGDDKQSIYRFRNAFPDIFNTYKKEFNTPTANCVFLRENFRCAEKIIDFTNDVFNSLWGEAYEKEQLIFKKKRSPYSEHDVTVKTFVTTLSNSESSVYEARYIADEILKLKERFIKEDGQKLRFSDVAVIIPVAKGISEIFIDEFRKKGVPVISNKSGSLTRMPEIKLFISILKAVDNPEDDVPLASAMNSFFFGFTADDLYEIRKRRDMSLWGSVLTICKEKSSAKRLKLKSKRKIKASKMQKSSFKLHVPIKIKCKKFAKRLEELRYLSRNMECKHFIWELLENGGILSQMDDEPEGEVKKGNLLLLYSEAIEFGRREYKTLSAFLKHTDRMETKAYSPEGVDAVSIMTIHGSKGLEFPVCFLANAGKDLSRSNFGAKMPIFDINLGVFLPVLKDEFSSRDTLVYKLLEKREKPESIAENQRRLYVALTRAREKLYVVGALSKSPTETEISMNPNGPYLNWILSSSPRATYEEEALVVSEDEEEIETLISQTNQGAKSEKEMGEEEFVYPYEVSVNIPRKLSVSELKSKTETEYSKTIRKKDFLTVPPFIAESKKISATEIGTANHTFMQFASFENCMKLGVENEADRLLANDMITDEQYKMLNFKNIKEFFKSPLWERIKKSPKIYREKRFTISDSSQSLLGMGNEPVLVQGVIDLFFENPDGTYTVVDYKTDQAKEGDESLLAERYEGQISYYVKAVKEITGKDVTEGILYSFALGKEIKVNIK